MLTTVADEKAVLQVEKSKLSSGSKCAVQFIHERYAGLQYRRKPHVGVMAITITVNNRAICIRAYIHANAIHADDVNHAKMAVRLRLVCLIIEHPILVLRKNATSN